MILKNVLIYTEHEQFVPGNLVIHNGFIKAIDYEHRSEEGDFDNEEVMDGHGCFCIPGMIDVHLHGCKGYDVCDGTLEAMEEIASYQASIGVTAMAPATMTLPVDEIERILKTMAEFKRRQIRKTVKSGADLVGINMEGPFISPTKKGAQAQENIIKMDAAIFQRFQTAANGLIKYMGIAPEEGDYVNFIQKLKKEVTISLAHTNADYDIAKRAFELGASHVVHLYNGMTTFSHRDPGVVGAVMDSPQVNAELICDGIHIHPSVIRATFAMLENERILLVSDSMRATGMGNGVYTLGGLQVEVKGQRATLVRDGALAGSVTSLPDCVRYAVREANIPLETAIACATIHPARSLGIYDLYGSISIGRKADLVLWDKNLNLVKVIKDGIFINEQS